MGVYEFRLQWEAGGFKVRTLSARIPTMRGLTDDSDSWNIACSAYIYVLPDQGGVN